jgi:hypothetical protein
MRTLTSLLAALAAMSFLAGTAVAQDQPAKSGDLRFELNNATTSGTSCQLTFVVRNQTGTAIDQSNFTIAIVDAKGQVTSFVALAFKPFAVDATRIQQFILPNQTCEPIAGIAVSDVGQCVVGGDESPVCLDKLKLSNKTSIAFPWQLD